MLDFRILGPVEALELERSIPLGGLLQRAVLAILILHRGEVVSSDRLIDELWGAQPPATAAKTLQSYVSRLRKALGTDVLRTQGGGYLLAVDAEQIDAERFARLTNEGRAALASGDAGRARTLAESALALWRGEALGDLAFRSFAAGEVARLEEGRLAALEDLAEAGLALGRHRELVGELERFLAEHPHRERARGLLMLALYRSGRHADALEAYQRGRRALADDLGLDPGPALRELEERILEHDPLLGAPPAPPVRSLVRRPGRWAVAGTLLLAAAIGAAVAELAGGAPPLLRAAPNSVAAIDPASNRVTAAVTVGARPTAIVYGSGSLWVANEDDETISRVDIHTLATEPAIPLRDPPTGIAFAAGAPWVVESDSTRTSVAVSRIDPVFDTVGTPVRVDDVVPGSPAAITGNGGGLVIAPNTGPLARINAHTGRVVSQQDPNSAPNAVAVGAGATWVTDGEGGNLVRVDPSGAITSTPAGDEPDGVAVGDGAIWVALTGDDRVIQVDPLTGAVTATIAVGQAPAGVTFGEGSVWVADSGDGTVTRIDPRHARVVATIPVGGSPQAVAVAGGRVWVTVDALTVPPLGRAVSAGTLRVDALTDVSSIDPALAYDPLADQLLYETCVHLVNFPDRSGAAGSQLVPEAAQSLPAISDGGRTYTFTIRPGFRFAPPSNEPVTAETFRDTILRSLSKRMNSPVAYEYADIVGAAAYTSGDASTIAGVLARGDKLTIRLEAPAPDLLARLAEPAMCAVPPDTTWDPSGVAVIPAAGPYTTSSNTRGQGIVLVRNPNYHGDRPRRFARIEVRVNVPRASADAQVLAGAADYATPTDIARAEAPALAARYGRGSAAARQGHEQYFVNSDPQLDLFLLNTHRPLFSNPKIRQAVSYAIDRSALARFGDAFDPLAERPMSIYLPPGIAGHTDVAAYPSTPDLRKARALARGAMGKTAVLDTCTLYPCPQQAAVVERNLAAIGIHVIVHEMTTTNLFATDAKPHADFDLAWDAWIPDYLDPDAMLSSLLENSSVAPTFVDAATRAELATAARLSGPERYLNYARLDLKIAREEAPLVAFGSLSSQDLFSARIGCQVFGVYGMDLGALCPRS